MRRIRLTESQLNRVIMESVKRIMKESHPYATVKGAINKATEMGDVNRARRLRNLYNDVNAPEGGHFYMNSQDQFELPGVGGVYGKMDNGKPYHHAHDTISDDDSYGKSADDFQGLNVPSYTKREDAEAAHGMFDKVFPGKLCTDSFTGRNGRYDTEPRMYQR